MLVGAPVFAGGEVPLHAVVLIYHHIGVDTPASTSLSPELFSEQLAFLVENDYHAGPLAALVDSLESGGTIPDRTVAFTFDDGYRSVYSEAFPRLRNLGWPFTVFVCPDDIDHHRGPVMTWDQLREMAAAGATVANHGKYHDHLQRRRPGETDRAWRDRTRSELLEAQARIEQEIGVVPDLFAYPYGEADEDLQELVRELGWVAFGQESGPMGESSDPTMLPRFPMAGPFAAMESFPEKVATLPFPVLEVSPAGSPLPTGGAQDGHGPVLRLTLGRGDYRADQLAAFASRQGSAEWEWVDADAGILEVWARQALPPGRSRYNITAPATDGRRYYWFSHTWIVGQAHKD